MNLFYLLDNTQNISFHFCYPMDKEHVYFRYSKLFLQQLNIERDLSRFSCTFPYDVLIICILKPFYSLQEIY